MNYEKWPEFWQHELYGEHLDKQLAEPREGGTVLCRTRGTSDPEILKYRDVGPGFWSGVRLYDSGLTAGSSVGCYAGTMRDSTDTLTLTLQSDTTKLISSTWVAGTGNGGLVSGSVAANTWYYVYLVMDDTTSVVDLAISSSVTNPALANHTYFRRVGKIRTNASSLIVPFVEIGGEFRWRDAIIDRALSATGSTSRITIATSLPPSSRCTFVIAANSPSTADHYLWVASANKPNSAASSTNHLFYLRLAQDRDSAFLPVATDASGNIYARSSSTTIELEVISYGWYDER